MPAIPHLPSSSAAGAGSTGAETAAAGTEDDVADEVGVGGAAQLTVIPPFIPWQFQRHGPSPEISDGCPEVHRPETGRLTLARPLAEPQLASTEAEASIVPEDDGVSTSVGGTIIGGEDSEALEATGGGSRAMVALVGGAADGTGSVAADDGAGTGAGAEAVAAKAGAGEAGGALAVSGGGVQEFSNQTSCKSPAGQTVRVSPVILPT